MRRLAAVLALAAVGVSPLAAAYTFYQTDPLTSVNTVNWWQAGAVTATSLGLNAPDASGGSLISKVASPTPNEYEVRASVRLVASGGTYTLFGRATSDARTGGAGAGTYLAYEMRNPTFDGSGVCSASFMILKSVGGSVSALWSFPGGCHNGMVLRLVVRGDLLLAYIDQTQMAGLGGVGVAAGQPGLGGYAMPSGNALGPVQAGPIDSLPPGAVNPASLGVAAFPNRIEMQWQGVTDDANGIGFWKYLLVRDGSYLGENNQAIFVDETVAPGSTHTYQIYAMDQHYGIASPMSATLTAAPAGATEPRRIGVRPEGAYWGAAGEQIDLRSGNLNYTVPLLKALARSGWSATFALSYNSQMWRNDAGGTWKLGRDVGYGLGWKLMAGSITPVYQGVWAIHHYVFTDATGAEYRLEVNNGNVWTSREGFYGSFDANTWYLYFPDGSRWSMWAQSGGNEEDAGTLYPTAVQDTNGNRIEITYRPGAGTGAWNTSARIEKISDARAVYADWHTYSFAYNTDAIPHLTSIQNNVYSSENYTFSYSTDQTLLSPFTGQAFGTAKFLQSIGNTGLGVSTSFQYAATSGEMTQMTTPLGGSLLWSYRTYTYSGGRNYREVLTRQVVPQSGAAAWTWNVVLDSNTNLHAAATVAVWGRGRRRCGRSGRRGCRRV